MMLLLSSSSSSFVNNNHPSLVVVVVVVVVLGTQVRSSSFEAVCPQLQLLGGQRVTCRLPVRLYDALHQPVAAAECRVEGSHINISSGGDITPPLRCEPGWVAQLIVYVMAQWGRRQEPKNGKNRKKKEKLTKDEQNTQHTHTHTHAHQRLELDRSQPSPPTLVEFPHATPAVACSFRCWDATYESAIRTAVTRETTCSLRTPPRRSHSAAFRARGGRAHTDHQNDPFIYLPARTRYQRQSHLHNPRKYPSATTPSIPSAEL